MEIDIRTITLEDQEAVLAMNQLLVAEKETRNSFIETEPIQDFPAFYEKTKAWKRRRIILIGQR
ncbi:hypothetical protein [Streptococcus sp. X13SY08]|uniref:hypothetical protein n=1 Tax=Streptococcus sp. X13SY08 TaxID=1676616 RepID=UPI0026BBEF1E